MSKRWILIALLTAARLFAADLSYFGFSGLGFSPTGSMIDQRWTYSQGSFPASTDAFDFFPAEHRLAFQWKKPRVELGLSSAYILSGRSVGGYQKRSLYIPLIPSFKAATPSLSPAYNMAFGAASPYGAYYALDWTPFNLANFRLKTHSAFATKIITYHAFAGLSFQLFSNGITPLEFSVEGGWGGSLKNLGEKEEAFSAVGMTVGLAQTLDLSSRVRWDARYGSDPKSTLLLIDISVHPPRWKNEANEGNHAD